MKTLAIIGLACIVAIIAVLAFYIIICIVAKIVGGIKAKKLFDAHLNEWHSKNKEVEEKNNAEL